MQVYIKENSWMASIAAKKLSSQSVAMVINKTIYLHNISKTEFLKNEAWVCHELKHIQQYQQNGIFLFLVKYLWESARKGYYNNKFEVEARGNENNKTLLDLYQIKTK